MKAANVRESSAIRVMSHRLIKLKLAARDDLTWVRNRINDAMDVWFETTIY